MVGNDGVVAVVSAVKEQEYDRFIILAPFGRFLRVQYLLGHRIHQAEMFHLCRKTNQAQGATRFL